MDKSTQCRTQMNRLNLESDYIHTSYRIVHKSCKYLLYINNKTTQKIIFIETKVLLTTKSTRPIVICRSAQTISTRTRQSRSVQAFVVVRAFLIHSYSIDTLRNWTFPIFCGRTIAHTTAIVTRADTTGTGTAWTN